MLGSNNRRRHIRSQPCDMSIDTGSTRHGITQLQPFVMLSPISISYSPSIYLVAHADCGLRDAQPTKQTPQIHPSIRLQAQRTIALQHSIQTKQKGLSASCRCRWITSRTKPHEPNQTKRRTDQASIHINPEPETRGGFVWSLVLCTVLKQAF